MFRKIKGDTAQKNANARFKESIKTEGANKSTNYGCGKTVAGYGKCRDYHKGT